MDHVNLILLLAVTLMLLYGIAGAYQPSVQASIPALVSQKHFMEANSIINTISSFSALMGPVLGGILYSTYGLKPVLYVCMICFFLSAVMEIFIQIPFQKQTSQGTVWNMVLADLTESTRFIRAEKPVIGKVLLAVCGINLFLSAMITVGMPYVITEILHFDAETGNKLYGFAEGALAAGGLTGGICAGIFANKLSMKKAGNLILFCAAAVFPMGAALWMLSSAPLIYSIMTICCFIITVCSTIFTVQIMAFIQTETPQKLIGKVIAVILAFSMCAQPLGNALYGVLFEICQGFESAVILFAGFISLIIAVRAKNLFVKFS